MRKIDKAKHWNAERVINEATSLRGTFSLVSNTDHSETHDDVNARFKSLETGMSKKLEAFMQKLVGLKIRKIVDEADT